MRPCPEGQPGCLPVRDVVACCALVQVFLDPDRDPCPCGSGNVAGACCMHDNGTLVAPSVDIPVPAATGYMHPGCYAAQLGSCSTKISREHAISRGVLELLAAGTHVDIGGVTWLSGEERRMIPANALASNVLCGNHNSALSGLDSFAVRAVSIFIAIGNDMVNMRRRRPVAVYLLNGQDLERWMLKCLCGLIVSGTAEVGALDDSRSWRPPRVWLECLFGPAPLPEDYGMWVYQPKQRSASCEFSIVSNPDVGPYGLAVSLFDRNFLLGMSRYSGRQSSMLEGGVYRPSDLWTTNGINDSVILLSWSARYSKKTAQNFYPNPRRSHRTKVHSKQRAIMPRRAGQSRLDH